MLTIEAAKGAMEQALRAMGNGHKFHDREAGERFDLIYGYTPERPACLVGWIIWLTDYELFQRIAMDALWNHASVGVLVTRGVLEVEGGEGGALYTALINVQLMQDEGADWFTASRSLALLGQPVH